MEERLARFSGTQEAIFFPSGYQANLALFSTLLGERDLVLSDQYNHASIIDGIRLSRGSKKIYRHRDLHHLEELLESTQGQFETTWIACESIYSMEGSPSPLVEIHQLARRYGAQLLVDEAHATGLFGLPPRGGLGPLPPPGRRSFL